MIRPIILKLLLEKESNEFYRSEFRQRMGYFQSELEEKIYLITYDTDRFTQEEVVKENLNHISLENKGYVIRLYEVKKPEQTDFEVITEA